MVELSNERVEQILHEETKKTEPLPLILRGIYIRYMNLFEKYFADWESLDNDKIAGFREQFEETRSLVRYYYLDIPQDICSSIREFEDNTGENLLGPEWKRNLYDAYDEFKNKSTEWDESEAFYKAAFVKEAIKSFYEVAENIFRDGFGTGSQTAKDVYDGISGLLFGSKKEK